MEVRAENLLHPSYLDYSPSMKDEWEYADFQLRIDTIEFNFKPGDIQLCNKAAINQHTVDDLHR